MKLHSLEEFDDFQPCFYESMTETDEEFFAPAPSEDIWKKFHLISTPPRSPEHVPPHLETTELLFPRFPAQVVSKMKLGLNDSLDDSYMNQTIVCPDLIKSKLIQDCMWSGHNEAGENIDNDSDVEGDEESSDSIPTKKENTKIVIASNPDCVDPSSVFPYPVSEPRDDNSEPEDLLSSGDPDDDDEEEIDVVTVERLQVIRRTLTSAIAANPILTIDLVDGDFAAPKLITQKSLTEFVAQKPVSPVPKIMNLKRKSVSMPSSPLPSAKRQKKDSKLSSRDLNRRQASIRLNMHDYLETESLSAYSDEDENGNYNGVPKRAQHNVLERKRRNDLKFSFHFLRQSVPALNKEDRSPPKVAILNKAAEFIRTLTQEGKKLERILNQEKLIHEKLQKRLRLLQCL